MNEMEISLKGLVFYILKHWMSILVGGFIGAIALGGFQLFRTAEASKNVSSEEVVINLTNQEKAYVISVYDNMSALRQVNSDRSASIIMKIDPENAVHKDLVYIINASDLNFLAGISQAYDYLLTGSEFHAYLSQKTELDYYDITETITVSYEQNGYGTTTSAIAIGIVSVDEESAERVASAVNEFITEKSEDIKKSGFEHDLILLSEDVYIGNDYGILAKQSGILSDIQNRSRTIIDTEAGLYGDQKAYYDNLFEENNTYSAEKSDNTQNVTPEVAPIRISSKYVLLGVFIGFVVMCGFYCVVYIIGNKADEDDCTESIYGLSLLGIIPGANYEKMLYKLRHLGKRTFDFEESINLLSARIELFALKENVTHVGIIGCGLKKYSEKAVDGLVDSLKKRGIETIIIDDLLYNFSAVNMLKDINSVIILEKIGITYRTEILKEKELVEKLGINPEGIVLAY